MEDFNVFDIFGKKIVGVNKVNLNKVELLFDDNSRLVMVARHGYQGDLYLDYLEAK